MSYLERVTECDGGWSSTRVEEVALANRMHAEMQTMLERGHRPGRTHWLASTPTYLLGRLHEEVKELEDAVRAETDPDEIWREAADVANFAAMIADVMAVLGVDTE